VELAPHGIRVNSRHPTGVSTKMILDDAMVAMALPGDPEPTVEKHAAMLTHQQAMPVPWVEPIDVSNALLFLASDEARYITGVALPVDAGAVIK
jgi:(+)-trans-carveol dehydrogenase